MEGDGLKPGLSLFDAATIVAGSMIGSGIFIVSADIARQVGSPAGLFAVWLLSGLMTIAGALSYGELAAMMPQAGGQYVFLREAYGGVWAFCFGWTLLLVIQTGTIAAVAVAFGRFAGVMFPHIGARLFFGIGTIGLSGERICAIIVIVLLTAVNLRGLNLGRLVQNLFTSAKVLSLLFIVVLGCVIAPNPAAIRLNFGSLSAFGGHELSRGWLAAFGAATVGALFSADAWANVTFTASEVHHPQRNLPRALSYGTALVITLYLLTNLSYLCELPLKTSFPASAGPTIFSHGIAGAASDRVATAAMQMVWGNAGAYITAMLVIISTFGCANGLILTGARVIYAMSRDGLFFAAAGRLNQAAVPAFALILQGLWASLLTVSGTYSQLLDYVIFAQLMFYVLTVGAVFILRVTRADARRPYRVWGYPWVPAIYILAATAIMADLLVVKPRYTWPGLIIAISGIPIYWFMQCTGSARSRSLISSTTDEPIANARDDRRRLG
ncbi:MAG TPA: amino acid permease [Candidatus Binataceae bacterium]|nr:amino acid permease [Candidatus Binataceae bacterium]